MNLHVDATRRVTAKLTIHDYAAFLWTYLRPHKGRVALIALLVTLTTALTLLNPQLLSQFIDAVMGGSNMTGVMRLAALFFILALVNQAANIALSYLSTDVGLRATNRLRADLTLHCLQLDLSFHNARSPGELIERIDGDVAKLNTFLSNFAIQVLRDLALIVGVVVAMFGVDWRAGIASSLCSVAMLMVLAWMQRAAVQPEMDERDSSAKLFGFVEEQLNATEDVRANGGVPFVMRRFFELSRAWGPRLVRAHWWGGSFFTVGSLMYYVTVGVVLAVGVLLFHEGTVTLGAVYLIYRYNELIRWPLQEIGRQAQDLQRATVAILRTREILNMRSRVEDLGTQTLPQGAHAVTFDRVTFRYEDDAAEADDGIGGKNPTLNGISFALQPGETLGLLGRTGSGKTTLTKLLFRLYDPNGGEICLDGVLLRDVPLSHLRSRVAMVTQDIQLFHATLRENLTLFNPTIPDERIVRAVEEVGLGTWYRGLPNGLDTVLSASSSGLSAGQAQLLALARAFLKDPGLIILDEASSRLDAATERALEQALDRLLCAERPGHGRRTAIVIAHRLATVRRADRVLILDRGECVEFGARDALAANPTTRFAQLLRASNGASTGREMQEVLA